MENDLIFRHAAIEALCRGEGCGNICRRAIERIPPAQRWIPVSEKLPAAFHQVLCYGHNGIMIDYFSGETTEIYGKPLFMISEAKITHWMPLPEPPKEEGK